MNFKHLLEEHETNVSNNLKVINWGEMVRPKSFERNLLPFEEKLKEMINIGKIQQLKIEEEFFKDIDSLENDDDDEIINENTNAFQQKFNDTIFEKYF